MPYTKAISPISNSYLTKGKEYEIVWIDKSVYDEDLGLFFQIKNDNKKKMVTSQHKSLPANMESWQLK